MIQIATYAKSNGSVAGGSGGGSSVTNNFYGKITPHYLWGNYYDGTSDISGNINASKSKITARELEVKDRLIAQTAEILSAYTSYLHAITIETEGDLTVSGKTTLQNTTINNELYVNGSERIKDNLYVGGELTVSGDTNVQDLYSSNITNTNQIKTKDLTVTGSAHFFELIIDKIKAAGGAIMLTPADGFAINKVESVEGGYKLYFRSDDGDGKGIVNMWKVNDQALCMSFNQAEVGTSYNVNNKYYWSLVIEIDEQPVKVDIDGDEYDCHYIVISNSIFDGTVNPEVGDEIVMCGYRGTDDVKRQSATYISAYSSLDKGLEAPLFATYQGINTFDLESHRKTFIDATRAEFIGSLKVSDGTTVEDYVNDKTTELRNEFKVDVNGLTSKVSRITNPNILPSNDWTDLKGERLLQGNEEEYTLTTAETQQRAIEELAAFPPIIYLDKGTYTMSVYATAKYKPISYGVTKDNLDNTFEVQTMINTKDVWHKRKRSQTTFAAPINGYYHIGIQMMDESYSGDTEYVEYDKQDTPSSGDTPSENEIDVHTTVAYVLPDSPQYVGKQITGVLLVKPADYVGKISYKSTNTDVATVDENGLITFVGDGTTTIIVTAHESYWSGKHYLESSASADISCQSSFDTDIHVLSAPTSLKIDDVSTIAVEVIPNHYPGNVTYKSNSNDVIKVDSDGNVTAIDYGQSVITVTAPAIKVGDVTYKSSTIDIVISVNELVLPPDNEIWFTSIENKVPRHLQPGGYFHSNYGQYDPFITQVKSVTFDDDGKGILHFDEPVTQSKEIRGVIGPLYDDEYVTSITLPKTLTNVCQGFACYSNTLREITIPNSVKSIGGEAFNENIQLREITIPNSVESFDGNDKMFRNCFYLSKVKLSNKLTELDGTFRKCKALGSIKIPDSIKRIDYYTFEGCTGLRSIYTNQVEYIGNYAFSGCTALTHVVFGDKTTEIHSPFDGCTSLEKIICLAATPPKNYGYDTIDNTKVTVYVPNGSINAYKAHSHWSIFNIVSLGDLTIKESNIYVNFDTYRMPLGSQQNITMSTDQPDGVIYSAFGGGHSIGDNSSNENKINFERNGNSGVLSTLDETGVSFLVFKVEEKIVDGVWYLPSMRILPIEVSKDNTYHDDSWIYMKPGEYEFKANIKTSTGTGYSYVTLYADRWAMTEQELVKQRILLYDTQKDRQITETFNFTKPSGWYKLDFIFSGTLNEPWTLIKKPSYASINIPEGEIIIESGETRQLNVTITPNGLTKRFESSDDAILSIDDNGYMTANAIGEAIVTVIVPEQTFDGDNYLTTSAEAHVKINGKIQTTCEISSVENPINVNMQGTGYIRWTPNLSDEYPYDLSHVVFESSNQEIATADYQTNNMFYVYGHKAGDATITLKLPEYTENGITYLASETSFDITINEIRHEVEYFTIGIANAEKNNLRVGQSYTLTRSVAPVEYESRTVNYQSSDSQIVTVQNNTITVVGNGNAKITGTIDSWIETGQYYEGATSEMNIVAYRIINAQITSNIGNKYYVDDTLNVNATVDYEGYEGHIYITSSDENIAVVNNGVITFNRLGDVTITISAYTYKNGTIIVMPVTQTYTIRVKQKVQTSLVYEHKTGVLNAGSSVDLQVGVLPSEYAGVVHITLSDNTIGTLTINDSELPVTAHLTTSTQNEGELIVYAQTEEYENDYYLFLPSEKEAIANYINRIK